MKEWAKRYVASLQAVLGQIAIDEVVRWTQILADALRRDAQIFVFGNGGSAAAASHFATDLGKGASDRIGRRFRVLSLNDNVSWLTALGNDYAYDQIFVGQLQNYARPGDVALAISVSGNSPNCVRAIEWAREHDLITLALVGGKGGRLADLAEHVLRVPETHYGRAEDAHLVILHLLCYAFMDGAMKI